MQQAGEASGPSRAGEAIAPLRGLLEFARLARRQPTLLETLRAVAAAVSDAVGFATVVINAYRADSDTYEVVTVHGSERANDILLGSVTKPETWKPLLDERFRRHGVYFVPEGSLNLDDPTVTWYRPEPNARAASLTGESWRTDDALFAKLEGSGGRPYGIISVDEPYSGLRPDDQQLVMLSALAAHAALAIESSRQMTALAESLARHRAVIASTLDCVVAADEDDRLIEFNPAAERAFDYLAKDVLGREVADVLVPPANRDFYRSLARRIRDNPDSSLLDRRIEATAMRSDGSEFPVELTVARVEGSGGLGPSFYGILRDIGERRRGEEQLAYLAYHDALTGLPNRILVEQEIDLALARARRAGGAAALMFVDLDDFKEVNDRLGHAAGDRLLAGVSARLRGVLRDSDVLARQGGDEFLVLLGDLSDDPTAAAESVGGKLLGALEEPFVVAGTEVRTGASIGISLYPDDAADTEALLRHADVAMYRAKAAGGGRLVFHQRSDTLSSRRSSLTSQLRSAIAAGEMELHYQPVWSLTPARAISGLEALLRWRHPEKGLLGPDAFMDLAEQSTAGDAIMGWVLEESCRHARAWRAENLVPLIGINVSPHQLRAPDFATRLAAQVAAAGVSPGSIALELTESAWSVDSTETLEVIEDLRDAGFPMALDDFGAGYSSLSRLLDLTFDVIKVDGRLLAGVPGDATAVKLLLAVFDVGAACGTDIIAGGVQTEAQLEFLLAHGISHAQGSALGEPMQAEELTPLLHSHLVAGPPPRRGSRTDRGGR
ncbi:MAG TPA: EAL domain-containing protein [Solirubrobacteraceae bacterium]|nr:EAL domain-containing protein [Solirubrobacteraceae bacterium]